MSNSVDWNNACLICLQKGENRFIFEEDNDSNIIADKIMKCVDDSIKRETNQPSKICLTCLDDLNVAYKFRQNCNQSHSMIKGLQNTNNEVFELKDLWKTTPVAVNPKLDICIKDEIMDNAVVGDTYENTLPLDLKDDPDTETKFVVKDNADACVRDNVVELNNVEATGSNKTNQEIKFEISTPSRGRLKKLSAESCAMASQIVDNAVVVHTRENTRLLDLEDDPETEVKFVANPAEDCDNISTEEHNNMEADESNEPEKKVNSEISKRPKVLSKKSEKKLKKICKICGHRFKVQNTLDIHMRRHNNVRPFSCDECAKAFVTLSELKCHMRVHTGQKPLKCQYCDRRFLNHTGKKNHERTHTGERPFVCSICGSSFAYPHVLKRHLQSHSDKKRSIHKKSCKIEESPISNSKEFTIENEVGVIKKEVD